MLDSFAYYSAYVRAWRYIWFDETFWQLLFFAVLFAIVILWRPSSTNRLYARSAFLDPDVEPPPEDLEERLLDVIVSGTLSSLLYYLFTVC
ncbi:unnamed protein product [Hymenolepis diminuta]|uniref:DUF202 domain-containing protein n=1 Tax=Hymenolepis diminuta TaxID=6216 RepID=A0A0R3SLW3_HYMDI|nr:unnamed protein product [Hymenolepis diminuta]